MKPVISIIDDDLISFASRSPVAESNSFATLILAACRFASFAQKKRRLLAWHAHGLTQP
jgi:hypothetical protein